MQRYRLHIFLACGLFLVAIGALFFGFKVGSPLKDDVVVSSVLREGVEPRDEHQGPLILSGERTVLYVSQFEDTRASDGEEQVVFLSFSLKELPEHGERLILLSRNKSKNGRRSDTSIAIEKTFTGIRPLVSNGNPARGGRWMVFSDHEFTVGVWYTLIVCRLESNIVSVYLVDDEGNTPVFLGAQKILNSELISNSYTISVGSIGGKSINGSIRTFGVLQGSSLFPEIENHFRASILQNGRPPKYLADKVQLWADPFVDQSPYRRLIRQEGDEKEPNVTNPNKEGRAVRNVLGHTKAEKNNGGKRKELRKNNRVRKGHVKSKNM